MDQLALDEGLQHHGPQQLPGRDAYAPLMRAAPMRFSAHAMSDVQWVGCIDAITPSSAKRGMSAAASTCACSIRSRASFAPTRALEVDVPGVAPGACFKAFS